mmetsp:Transcript_51937/g.112947  ORF Transcript_51937/g.112947 Transcript_51937/m.112947 type:complete len:360 (-) Transcript_51937:43-1122(-)
MLGKSASPMATTLTHLPSHTTTASIASSAKGCSHSHAWEVVIAEDHLVIVVAVVLGEEAQLAEEVVGLDDHGLSDFERENALVGVGLDAASRDILGAREESAVEQCQCSLQPLLARKISLLRLGHVGDDAQLFGTSREDHLSDVTGSALALLLSRITLNVHGLHRLDQKLDVPLRLIHGGAKKLEASHIGGTLDFDTALATFLHDLLQLRLTLLLGGKFLLLLLILLLGFLLLLLFFLLLGLLVFLLFGLLLLLLLLLALRLLLGCSTSDSGGLALRDSVSTVVDGRVLLHQHRDVVEPTRGVGEFLGIDGGASEFLALLVVLQGNARLRSQIRGPSQEGIKGIHDVGGGINLEGEGLC